MAVQSPLNLCSRFAAENTPDPSASRLPLALMIRLSTKQVLNGTQALVKQVQPDWAISSRYVNGPQYVEPSTDKAHSSSGPIVLPYLEPLLRTRLV